MSRREAARPFPDRSTQQDNGPRNPVSIVSARISPKVATQGRVQSLAAQCAASLEGHSDHRVAIMLAFLLGWESRAAEALREARGELTVAQAVSP